MREGRIDADVHQAVGPDFFQRMPRPWRDLPPIKGPSWPAHALGHSFYRADVHEAPGAHHDTRPTDVVDRLLEPYGMDYAILTGNAGTLGLSAHPNPHYARSFVQCYNDWLLEVWLDHDPRLKGSMLITPEDPGAAVREIERIGGHRDVVQVLMPSSAPQLYGGHSYWPIYEAAAGYGLPVAIHPTGGTLQPPTTSGWPTTYLEAHTMISTGYMNHLISLLCQGVFEEIPSLRFVLIEGGLTVFAPLLWRLEKNWKAVRSEVPWLRHSPRRYLRDHLRFTTQPIEEPDDDDLLIRLFEDLDGHHTILFATDWPHWDFDDPEVVLRRFPADLRARILWGNACALYGLDDDPGSN